MKVGIIADIHGNLPALEAVLAALDAEGVDTVLCAGDLVDYGPYPNEVVDWIRTRKIPCVLGNHDDGVGFDRPPETFAVAPGRDQALELFALVWTQQHTSPESKAFLRSLPRQQTVSLGGRQCYLVHATPDSLTCYLSTEDQTAFTALAGRRLGEMIIMGHTHRPFVFWVDNTLFINPGSVGKPKHGDPRAGYAVLELGDAPVVTLKRCVYDVKTVIRRMRQYGLPELHCQQLKAGNG